jgi:hypothetical protein
MYIFELVSDASRNLFTFFFLYEKVTQKVLFWVTFFFI